MGQSTSLQMGGRTPSTPGSSRSTLANELDFLHDQIRKHSLTLRQLTTLTYDDLQGKISELNNLSSKFVDCNGKQLVFELKDGAEAPAVLWKGLVRVRCMKINPTTSLVEKCRDLNLKQFLQVYNTMTQMQGTIALDEDISEAEREEDVEKWDMELGKEAEASMTPSPYRKSNAENIEQTEEEEMIPTTSKSIQITPVVIKKKKPVFAMSTSIILDELSGAVSPTSAEECCICMENRPDVSLPCAHSYCLPCIEQWNVNHKTCPICREKLDNTDETWVLQDIPNTQDVAMEMRKSFFELTK